jgi:hypothetical protein
VDNSTAGRSHQADQLRWAPPLGLVALGWVGAAAAVFWVTLGATEPTGRLLAGATVLVLASAALFGSRARPRLAADRGGLTVRGLGRQLRFEWSRVSRVRVVHTRRFGRDLPTLEIDARGPGDTDDRLMVFGWLDLGADPREVARALDTVRRPSGNIDT